MELIVNKLFIYPIKSVEGTEVNEATISDGGALLHDRQYALFNAEGRTVNAKKYPNIQKVRADFQIQTGLVTLSAEGFSPTLFDLEVDHLHLQAWFSDYLHIEISLKENKINGFPDDDKAYSFTIASLESLVAMQTWFPDLNLDLDNLRRRFRYNVEIKGAGVSFIEDQFFGENVSKFFKIGNVQIEGVQPCNRCPVPTRNPFTGVADQYFQKTFVEKRRENLPNFAPASRFDHTYKFSANTRVPLTEVGKTLRVGDVIYA